MLLAKSDENDPDRSLRAHTERVVEAAEQLRVVWPFLPATLIQAAWFHDFGKAADGFQKMLLPNGPAWRFRHEVLSAEVFRRCFNVSAASPDVWRAYLALLTHHKNLGTRHKVSDVMRACAGGKGSRWPSVWRELPAGALRDTFPETLAAWENDVAAPSPADEIGSLLRRIPPVWEDLLLAQMRGALVAADHLASSGVGRTPLGEALTETAIERYMVERAEKAGKQFAWTPLQDKAATVCGSALLLAPTGSGKTEAALRWAMNNRAGYERVFYVLPYQVSINAMAERLCRVFPDERQSAQGKTAANPGATLTGNHNVAVVHANTDLAYLRDALRQAVHGAGEESKAADAARSRTEAARKIYAPLKVTTVYQLLALFFGRKFFEVGLLELSGALVIFDEIHAYDGHVLGLIHVLLRCLRRLGARVLVMTATLPPALEASLTEAANLAADARLTLPDNDTVRTELRRKIIRCDAPIQALVPQMKRFVRRGRRVAVVCNTVDKAILLYEELSHLRPLLIHSRFALRDRAIRETEQNVRDYRLVIATQVIEVSLDVSFDAMFTELAPADALLQRFGRVNRHDTPGPGHCATCVIACANDGGSRTIYGKELLDRTRDNLHLVRPLHFKSSLDWLGAVYPDGLPSEQQEKMRQSEGDFSRLVEGLRPLLDPPADVDVEQNLFETITVVPVAFAVEWGDHKKAGDHTGAKGLTVNVDKRVWKAKTADWPSDAATYNLPYGSARKPRQMPVACFPYDGDTTGLRLDLAPVPQRARINDCIFGGDEPDDPESAESEAEGEE